MANPLDSFRKFGRSNDFRVPEMPNVFETVQSHGLMRGLQILVEQQAQWKLDLERAVKEQLDAVTDNTSDVTTPEPTPAQTVTVIQQAAAPASESDAELQAHIVATQAHGAIGQVVGTNNEQTLERKTIGKSNPRPGKFTSVIQSNEISSGELVIIPAGYNMVVGGTLTVNGELQCNGELITV